MGFGGNGLGGDAPRHVGRWAGDVDGTALELRITTNHLGAWEIRLREPGGRQVTRWFDGPEQAHTYAASVFAAGAWRRLSSSANTNSAANIGSAASINSGAGVSSATTSG